MGRLPDWENDGLSDQSAARAQLLIGRSLSQGELERLQKLRESGPLTDSEFEQEKAKILSES